MRRRRRASTMSPRASSVSTPRMGSTTPCLTDTGRSEPIDARRRVVEELGALRSREAGGEALERVPEDRVAAARHVDREVRLEHAAIDAELLDRVLVVRPCGVAELLAARRARALVPAEAIDLHDPAELGDDVGAGGDLGDRLLPLRVDVLGAAGVRSDAERPAEVIQDDRGGGKRARQRGHVGNLMMVEPRLERELARRQLLEAHAEIVAQQE